MRETVAIVGANLAGMQCAANLRAMGCEDRIYLIGDEHWAPYERPPLSKEALFDSSADSPSYFKDLSWYFDNDINIILDQRVTELELRSRRVRMGNSQALAVDKILLATGGMPRRLDVPGACASNVHYLRTARDAANIRAMLKPGARVAIVGMGVIGAEVAASARKIGCEVTAVEPANTPMRRALGGRFGTWLAQIHECEGVTVRLGANVDQILTDSNMKAYALLCSEGQRIECDVIVIGVGISPAIELAVSAGLTTDNGIVVDSACRTSNAFVWAAGDVTSQPGFFGGRTRMETYANASEQGMTAARSMLGLDANCVRPCNFWSDQYDMNIQVFGRIDDHLEQVVRGDPEERKFTSLYLSDQALVGVLAVNNPSDIGACRRMIEQRRTVEGIDFNSGIPIRQMLK